MSTTISCVVYYTARAIVRRMIIFRLDKVLEKRGCTAYKLAKESGIHPSVLSKYVNNQVREISLDTLNALCEALKCRAGDLIEYVPDSKQKSRR